LAQAVGFVAGPAGRGITVFAANGRDTITGSGGADRIFGEGGNDRIRGGLGNDTLDGGAGVDTYLLEDTAQTNGSDAIAFSFGTGGDILDISSSAFSPGTTDSVVELTQVADITAASVGVSRIIVLTANAPTAVTAASLEALLNASDLDTTQIGVRFLILDAGSELRVFRISNTDTQDNNDVLVELMATTTNVSDIAPGQIVAGNFDGTP
jgi:Ca2+-binding RTX toxin-like protein